MGGRARSRWLVVAAVAIAVVTVVVLYVVWRSPNRKDLIDFWGFAAAIAVIAGGRIAWTWAKSKQADRFASRQELGHLTDLLAGAVEEEWKQAAGQRGLLEPEPIPVRWQQPAAPFTGPTAAAVASTRFMPLPGIAAAGEQQLQAGYIDDLHALYGGLGSGRLVIVGAPGSGKSGGAVLLILAALHYRQSVSKKVRPQVPVPVMFTLQGWDPNTQRSQDWLAERLWQTYPLFAGKQGAGAARGMLAEGRIAVILDGLDEIPEDLRPAVLRALSQQATFRLVLLTRSAEMAAAANQARLQGAAAIELQDIDPSIAADYLTRTQLDPPPQRWHELTSRLSQEPGSPLAQALNNPLMLTLVRDTYRHGDDAGELLRLRDAAGHPASGENIVDHLLDRVLPAAYTQQPGEPPLRYDLPTAERALRRIATRMDKDGTRDLQWWHIPAWVHAAPRVVATCLTALLATGLVYWLAAGLADGLVAGFRAALVAGPVEGLVVVLVVGFGRGGKGPKRMAPVRWRQLFRRRPIGVGLLAGLLAGGVAQNDAVSAGASGRLAAGLAAGLAGGLAAGLTVGLVAGMSRPGTDNTSPLSPLASWRSDRAFGLVVGLMAGVVVGLWVGIVDWLGTLGLVRGLVNGLVIGIGIGIGIGIAYPQSWLSSLAFAQLAASDRTPVRLMRFLEDAHSRNVLRTVGPVYQFRHASLQDRLAGQESTTRQDPSEAHSKAGDVEAPTTR